MTARKRTDAEPPIPAEDEAESAPQAEHTYGGLDTMIAREVAIQARRDRARREFFRIEHASLIIPDKPESQFLGLYRVTGESSIPYDVLMRDPNHDHFVNRCSCPDYEQANLGTCKHIEAVIYYIRRKHASEIRATKPRMLEINRLTVYITLRYVGDAGWTAAPVYDHALDPGLLRLVNHYLMPYLHLLEEDPTLFLTRLAHFLTVVDEFGGTAVVEPEVYDYANTSKGHSERDERRRTLISAVEAGQARLDLLNLPLYPYQAVGTLFLAFTERALLADDMGLGKAQPLDAKILTPYGWTLMGNVQTGDEVINSQGNVSHVIGVYPQGFKDVFRVEFTDGSSTECCDDHLWLVNSASRRWKGYPPRTMMLRDMRENLREPSGNSRYFIPVIKPVQFGARSLLLDPYLLGALIGDGSLTQHSLTISSADDELLNFVREKLPCSVNLNKIQGYDWRISQGRTSKVNPVMAALRSLDVAGKKSEKKFIPTAYKFASLDDRTALLQGLLDTDGCVRKADNNIEFSTTSHCLAKDMIELVQSLGGRASLRHKTPTFTYKGERRQGQLSYRMSIALPSAIEPFRLSRKAQLYHPRTKYPPARAIRTVTYVGQKETQCIAVDSLDNLYVTDDYILTHNTVQAIAASRLLKDWHDIKKVLIVTPASVKFQWGREIERFTGESYVVVGGTKAKRAQQYEQDSFFTVINYELVLRDLEHIHALKPDLVILDEAQRIKNWRAKTSQALKDLPRPFAFVLSGTPLENRLEELYSIVEFLDDRLLGPPWQFMARHVIKDEWGGIIGYKDLAGVRRAIAPILLRRRKADVLQDLPERIDNDFWLELETEQERVYKPLQRAMDALLRLSEWGAAESAAALGLLTRLRECATAAQLADPSVHSSSKLRELPALVAEIASEGHKMLIFSQWERMTRYAQEVLTAAGWKTVRLHGGLSMRERTRIIDRFTNDPDIQAFISTDAGGLGLNLQVASFVINLDLPWNPARVEQRIGRAHRIGQTQPVNVINMIALNTIEQRVLDVLYRKQELFDELLDVDLDPETGTFITDVVLPAERLRHIVELLMAR